jgi:hypothetical protein
MIKDYLLIIVIALMAILYTEHKELRNDLLIAKTLTVELYDENESFIEAISSLNEHIDTLEQSSKLIKDLHRITK